MEIVPLNKALILHLVDETGTLTCENAFSLYLHNFVLKKDKKNARKTTVIELGEILASQGKNLSNSSISRRLDIILEWNALVKKSLKKKNAQIYWENFKQKLRNAFHQPREKGRQLKEPEEMQEDIRRNRGTRMSR